MFSLIHMYKCIWQEQSRKEWELCNIYIITLTNSISGAFSIFNSMFEFIIYKPQINSSCAFVAIHRCADWGTYELSSTAMIPAETAYSYLRSALLFLLLCCKQESFHCQSNATHFTCLCLFWWFYCLKVLYE